MWCKIICYQTKLNYIGKCKVFNGESNREQVALFVDLDNFIGFCSGFGLKMELEQAIRKLTEHGRVVIRKSFGDIYKLPLDSKTKESIRMMLQDNLIQHEDVRHLNKFKNSSDIRLIIEALSIAYTNPTISTFAVIADDRDYIPLFNKLREIGKTVIGIGSSKDSTQEYYRSACDNFYYHDSITGSNKLIPDDELADLKEAFNETSNGEEDEVIALFIEATKAVEAKGKSPLGSMVAQMMRALKSDLDFSDYGFTGLKAVAARAQERGFVETTKHGGDISIACVDGEINKYFEYRDVTPAVEISDDRVALIGKYRTFVEGKLKAPLPTPDQREIIYDLVMAGLEKATQGVSLNDLSKEIAQNPALEGVSQSSVYKILYNLFRSRAFTCTDSYNQYNPVIVGLNESRQSMDYAFLVNLLKVFKRESKGIPFDSVAWSLYLYDDEAYADMFDM